MARFTKPGIEPPAPSTSSRSFGHRSATSGGSTRVEWMTGWLALGGVIDEGASDAEVRARYFPPARAAGDARIKVAQTIPKESEEILRSYLQLIEQAESSIWIESPYIAATEIQEAPLSAVRERGVDVHVIIPGDNNHPACEHAARPALRALVAAGGSVYAYDGMNHAKVRSIDDRYAIIGTANLDALSLKRVYEVNLHIDDPETVGRVQAEIFRADLAKAKKLSVADLEVGAYLAEPFFGAMAPLFVSSGSRGRGRPAPYGRASASMTRWA